MKTLPKTLAGGLAALTLAASLVAAAPAEARGGRNAAIAAGVFGALALGAIAASSAPAYAEPVYARDCYVVRKRFIDDYGYVYFRRVRVCD